MSSDNPNYDNSVIEETGSKNQGYITVNVEPPPHDTGYEELEMTCIPGSRSGSFKSHDSANHSSPSTPKLFRMFKIGNSISALSASKSPQMGKNTLKRTASHTPEAPKQYTPVCLRRTQSAMSLGKDNRISGESLLSFASTSSESLSEDGQLPGRPRKSETRRLLTLSKIDPENYGELMVACVNAHLSF